MALPLATYGLAAVAGGLSTLSPCVLPLVPIIVGTAAATHRFGPMVLAAGLAVSFTVLGVLIAAFGAALGLTGHGLRLVAAVLLVVFGLLLLSEALQARFALLASRASSAGHGALGRFEPRGLTGQALLGLLLGVVWSPCVGPTLGATITLASQGEDLAQATLVMLVFGIGAGVPLVVLGLVSGAAMKRFRGRLLDAGKRGKRLLGMVLLLAGFAILTGADKQFEIWALDHAPGWLIDLTTSI